MSDQILPEPGLIVLFGSGETSPTGRKIFDNIFQTLPPSPRLALLETPAGFQLNSYQVIKRVGDFFSHRLQNYSPQVEIISARNRCTSFSPDNPEIVDPLLKADMIFLGPGSPTYATRQLRHSLAWQYMIARHRLGATLTLASAATIAFSAYALPVYEIYKVGEDLHWKRGLDFFKIYGLNLVFVPHWNNQEGGIELDTSRCFMGQERFTQLIELLPENIIIVGIDEKTALIMNPVKAECLVQGLGKVTILHTPQHSSPEILNNKSLAFEERQGFSAHQYQSGESFPMMEFGDFNIYDPKTILPVDIWNKALQAISPKEHDSKNTPSDEVIHLIQAREQARNCRDWTAADNLRQQIFTLGWEVIDTDTGPISRRITENSN